MTSTMYLGGGAISVLEAIEGLSDAVQVALASLSAVPIGKLSVQAGKAARSLGGMQLLVLLHTLEELACELDLLERALRLQPLLVRRRAACSLRTSSPRLTLSCAVVDIAVGGKQDVLWRTCCGYISCANQPSPASLQFLKVFRSLPTRLLHTRSFLSSSIIATTERDRRADARASTRAAVHAAETQGGETRGKRDRTSVQGRGAWRRCGSSVVRARVRRGFCKRVVKPVHGQAAGQLKHTRREERRGAALDPAAARKRRASSPWCGQ
jgi:hypothetical protein